MLGLLAPAARTEPERAPESPARGFRETISADGKIAMR